MIPQLQREEIVVTLHIDSFCAVGVGKHLDILPEGHWELFECVNNVWEKICSTLHYRINVALFLLIFAEISCATFISHAQLLFIFKNFECATFIRLRYICFATAWCFINNCFKANLKHLMVVEWWFQLTKMISRCFPSLGCSLLH